MSAGQHHIRGIIVFYDPRPKCGKKGIIRRVNADGVPTGEEIDFDFTASRFLDRDGTNLTISDDHKRRGTPVAAPQKGDLVVMCCRSVGIGRSRATRWGFVDVEVEQRNTASSRSRKRKNVLSTEVVRRGKRQKTPLVKRPGVPVGSPAAI